MDPIEKLERPNIGVPFAKIAGPDNTVGRTVLSSGSVTQLASTTLASSDSIILLTGVAASNVSSGVSRGIEVKSINPGVGFVVGTDDGVALDRNTTVHWMILRTG